AGPVRRDAAHLPVPARHGGRPGEQGRAEEDEGVPAATPGEMRHGTASTRKGDGLPRDRPLPAPERPAGGSWRQAPATVARPFQNRRGVEGSATAVLSFPHNSACSHARRYASVQVAPSVVLEPVYEAAGAIHARDQRGFDLEEQAAGKWSQAMK